MAKRMQGQSEENRIVAKSSPTAINLTSSVPTCSSSVNSPNASKSPGYSKLQVDRLDYQGGLMQAPIKIPIPTQRRVPRMAMGCSTVHQHRKLVATDKDQKSLNRQENLTSAQGHLWQTEHQGCSRNPEVSEDSEGSELESRIWPHHFRTSPNNVDHMEKVFLMIRKTYVRKPTDDLTDLDVNTAIWGIFYVCHTSRCSSSWTRLFTTPTIYQESTFEVCESIISDN